MTTVYTPPTIVQPPVTSHGPEGPGGPNYLVQSDGSPYHLARPDVFTGGTTSPFSVDAADIETISDLFSSQTLANDPKVKSFLDKLKAKGIIDQNMPPDQIMANIHGYFLAMMASPSCDLTRIDPLKLANFEASLMTQGLMLKGMTFAEAQSKISIVQGQTLFNEPDIRIVYQNQNNERMGLTYRNQAQTVFNSSIYSAYLETRPQLNTTAPPLLAASAPPPLAAAPPPLTGPASTAPPPVVRGVDLLGGIPDITRNAGSYIDNNLDDFIQHLTQDPPIYYGTKDAKGFWHVNSEKMTKDLMAILTAFQVMTAMVNLANLVTDSIENIALQLMELDPSELSTSKERQKLAENTNKLSQKCLEGAQTLMNLFWQAIDSLNNAEYQKQKSAIDKDYAAYSWSDFCTGGDQAKKKEERMSALDNNMQSVYKDNLAAFAKVQAVLMTNQLMSLSSLDLGDKNKLDELQKNFEDRIKNAFTNTDAMFITDTGTDRAGYLKFNDKMFVDAFTAMQQLFAIMRALMIAKQVQINALKQVARQLNDYSNTSGDLVEAGNNFLEVKMNLVQQNILRVQSLAQGRVSYYNQYKQHEINARKLALTQWSKILSFFTLGILGIVNAINNAIVEQATPQTADPNQTQFTSYEDWYRSYNNQPSPLPINPNDDSTTKGVTHEANAITNLQSQEQYYLQQLYNLSTMVDVGSGRKVVDWAAFAAIQNQLKRLQEAQRAVFQAFKAQLDTIETMAADLADKPKQHLYKQLDRMFESRFEMQGMVLEVFKFSLQQTQWANLLNAQVYSNRWSAWLSLAGSLIGGPILSGLFGGILNWFANPFSGRTIDYSKLENQHYNYTGQDALPANLQGKSPDDPAVEAWAREQWAKQNPGQTPPTGQEWAVWKSETFCRISTRF